MRNLDISTADLRRSALQLSSTCQELREAASDLCALADEELYSVGNHLLNTNGKFRNSMPYLNNRDAGVVGLICMIQMARAACEVLAVLIEENREDTPDDDDDYDDDDKW